MPIYLNLPGVDGSVSTVGFDGAIDVASFSVSAAGPGSATPGWSPLEVSTADPAVSVQLLADLFSGAVLDSATLSSVDLSSGAPVVDWQLVMAGNVRVVGETTDDVEPGGTLVPPGGTASLPVGFDVFFDVFFDTGTLTLGGPGTNVPETPYAALLPAVAAVAAGGYALRARSRQRPAPAGSASAEHGTSPASVASGPTPGGVDES